MTVAEVRQKYLEFFEARGHIVIPSASLVPENDPTTLFTGSGMQPLIPYLLGQAHPKGRRLANSQKCFRSEDIEEVGDNRHTTFFEMLGNWSLGDYWKEEQMSWLFEFLTKELGIKKGRLWVTCFEGDEKFGLPRDEESANIWERLGIPKDHIRFYDAKKNWWSRSGTPEKMPVGEPGGPDSEVFFDFDSEEKRGVHECWMRTSVEVQLPQSRGSLTSTESVECHPNCDCGRFMEIGNSVFMEYRKVDPRTDLGSGERSVLGTSSVFKKLPQRNVDFGGGLERITAAVNDEPDVFMLDVFAEKKRRLEGESGKSYTEHPAPFRIILDHSRAAAALMDSGVAPSNLGQGYVVRRLLRRAILYADRLGAKVGEQFSEEEEKFRRTLATGLREFERMTRGMTPPAPRFSEKAVGTPLTRGDFLGSSVFTLFSTYGLPIDLLIDLAREKGLSVDVEGFEKEFKKHQKISRAGAEKKFKGGLADTSEMSLKYHTATHLLHQALRDVLGPEVRQKGSNITPERLRFDFTFPRKMTEEERKKVEDAVNAVIARKLPVHKVTLRLPEAKKSGALHFFDEKYPDEVLVHYIGDSLETAYSKEFCGGPHMENTGVLGTFTIVKEEAVSAGVRRIKAALTN